ncbi:hypothetical protein BGZ63DRAFT_366607 [Mariannaea sp. PMI_226]|nr:hypothetical protein BGZ63DRAFT_366607 [Mariannaea sp. PMI_226]
MVIGLLTIVSIPTVTGVAEAVSAQKQQNANLTKEQEKFSLAFVMPSGSDGKLEETGTGVLVDNQLYLNLPDHPVEGHKFCGYYFKYPSEEQHLGLVSTISNDPPMLNWMYVNQDTHAVQYGGRKDTIGHVIGPWGWSKDDRYLTLEGDHDVFVAVQNEHDGKWVVYWDPEGDMLEEKDPERCKPVALRRRMEMGVESRYVRD